MYVASNGTKTAVILQDTDPQNPRDPGWQENLGSMVCWHKRYNLGDKPRMHLSPRATRRSGTLIRSQT